MKDSKAITLVSLVITVIVLAIIAGITISAVIGDSGMIEMAAQEKANIEGEVNKRQDAMDRIDEQMNTLENVEVPLETITAKATNITATSFTIVGVTAAQVERYEYYVDNINKGTDVITGLTPETTYSVYVKAFDKIGNELISETIQVTTLEATVKNMLKEGDYVTYIDGTGTTRQCVVLYDANSGYGVQIITMESVTNVALGNGTGSTVANTLIPYYEIAKTSYNNGIATLNSKASTYLNTTYASSARCVGSLPADPSSESGYCSDNNAYLKDYVKELKDLDSNVVPDWNQLKRLKIQAIGSTYWMASRDIYINQTTNEGFFTFRYADAGGGLQSNDICRVYATGSGSLKTIGYYSYTITYGFRPVFTLIDTIKIAGGTGKSTDPYTLQGQGILL